MILQFTSKFLYQTFCKLLKSQFTADDKISHQRTNDREKEEIWRVKEITGKNGLGKLSVCPRVLSMIEFFVIALEADICADPFDGLIWESWSLIMI